MSVGGVTGAAEGRPEDFIVSRALRHLASASGRAPRLAEAHEQVAARIHQMRAAISPRAEYRLVHGELHPGHVLLDDRLTPVLIDIEGLTYFDVEWDHAFLRIILAPQQYARLGLPPVDERRVAFYDFAQRLSLIEGPLRIAATDFPRGDFMREIAAHHLGCVLALVS